MGCILTGTCSFTCANIFGNVSRGRVERQVIQLRVKSTTTTAKVPTDKMDMELGDEALACLRDLRKWLQNYDAKFDRLEVACAIANTTLVTQDIPAIISMWEKAAKKQQDPYLDRVALACLELLVPLTWPIEIVGKEDAAEKFSQSLFLKDWQSRYKKSIVLFPEHNVLLAVVKLAAASAMRVPLSDREPRDEGILTLVCSFFRNILAIENEDDQGRALVAKEFQRQKVLKFLLSMASGLGSQFDSQDTVLLEIVYYLVRSVDIPCLYGLRSADDFVGDANSDKNLKQLLETEENMNRSAFKPTRHSRFGTLISLDYGRGDQVSLSGQRGVLGLNASLKEMDAKKKWKKPRERAVGDETEKGSFLPQTSSINSDGDALLIIKRFASDFLDSSFNPLFSKVRKLVEKMQSPRITKRICTMFCYLLGWFIDIERTRSRAEKKPVDYQLIGDALQNSSLTVVAKVLVLGFEMGEMKSTDLVHSSMYALRQILHTIRDMSFSSDQNLVDIADGMKSRLFYDDQWLTVLSKLPRSAYRKSLVYACETVSLTHIVLKMLDEYSKQHTFLFVKTNRIRRIRAKNTSKDNNAVDGENDVNDIDALNDHRESARVTSERKFTFEKFLLKYINDPTISIYERILENFREAGPEIILQVFSFFRRTFAKTPFKAMFYRMSLMRILLDLVDPDGLPIGSEVRNVVEEFLAYFVKKFVLASSKMPSLHIQVNEIMTPADAFYYDHGGQDKERFRAPLFEYALTKYALQNFDLEKQTAVLVASLIDNEQVEYVKWIEKSLMEFLNNDGISKAKETGFESLALNPDQMKAVYSDGVLRLFLRFMGLIVDTTQGKVVIPGDMDELVLINKLQWLAKYQNNSVDFDNGKTARDYIIREGQSDDVDLDYDDNEANDDNSENLFINSETRQSLPVPDIRDRTSIARAKPRQAPPSNGENGSRDEIQPLSKRPYADAFALDPSESELSETDEVSKSIDAIRKKKRAVLDDDEDDD